MNTIARVKECVEAIYAYDYFVSNWELVKHKKPLEECTEDELLRPFEEFWDSLPDNKACRRAPFMQVCTLAENWCSLFDQPGNDYDQS